MSSVMCVNLSFVTKKIWKYGNLEMTYRLNIMQMKGQMEINFDANYIWNMDYQQYLT